MKDGYYWACFSQHARNDAFILEHRRGRWLTMGSSDDFVGDDVPAGYELLGLVVGPDDSDPDSDSNPLLESPPRFVPAREGDVFVPAVLRFASGDLRAMYGSAARAYERGAVFRDGAAIPAIRYADGSVKVLEIE